MKVAPADVSAREAQKIAAEMLRPMNQGLELIGSATQFRTYVEGVYRRTAFPLLSAKYFSGLGKNHATAMKVKDALQAS